ncbi:MAG: flagellar motor protein MotB [Bacteroidia bacterium]
MKNTNKIFFIFSAAFFLLTSCVSQKKYNDMYALWVYTDGQYQILKQRPPVEGKNWKILQKEIERLRKDSANLDSTYQVYIIWCANEKSKLQANISGLAKQVDIKNVSLKLSAEKIKELEYMLYRKDSIMRATHARLAKALLGFKEKGVRVHVEGGKVYISLDERLLFQSGQIDVNPQGILALIEISKVLNFDTTTNLTVEGHTDDIPFKSKTKPFKDNWDISVLRATSVVRLMTSKGSVSPKRFTASGRAEFFPLDPAKTPEARKKNRRIEIIVTPDLDEIARLLNNN